MRRSVVPLLLVLALLGCRQALEAVRHEQPAAELESPLDLVREWPTRYPAQAVWLALWECEDVRPLAWPAIHSRLPYLRRQEDAQPSWIAVEMSGLNEEAQETAWSEVCDAIGAADPSQRYLLPASMLGQQEWMRQWRDAVNTLQGLRTTSEAVLAAAFLQPETQDLFDRLLRARGWQRETTNPGDLAGTLTSAEHADLSTALTRRLAGMTDTERARWFNAAQAALERIAI